MSTPVAVAEQGPDGVDVLNLAGVGRLPAGVLGQGHRPSAVVGS